MARKPGLCFIDDEKDELARAKKALSQRFDVGVGWHLEDAVEDLKRLNRRPQLFLLDMYYGPTSNAEERERVAKAWERLRIHAREFYKVLDSLGQSPEQGFQLAKLIREKYPGVPIAFLTRKGSLDDANKAFREGAVAVLKKPDCPEGHAASNEMRDALDEAMLAHRDILCGACTEIIERNRWWRRHARLRGFLEGIAAAFVGELIWYFLMHAASSIPRG